MTGTVIVLTNPNQLPPVKCRMESAPTVADAAKWADKLGRTVYYVPSNHSAYAPMEEPDVQPNA